MSHLAGIPWSTARMFSWNVLWSMLSSDSATTTAPLSESSRKLFTTGSSLSTTRYVTWPLSPASRSRDPWRHRHRHQTESLWHHGDCCDLHCPGVKVMCSHVRYHVTLRRVAGQVNGTVVGTRKRKFWRVVIFIHHLYTTRSSRSFYLCYSFYLFILFKYSSALHYKYTMLQRYSSCSSGVVVQ